MSDSDSEDDDRNPTISPDVSGGVDANAMVEVNDSSANTPSSPSGTALATLGKALQRLREVWQ